MSDLHWYAAYIKPRHERTVASSLDQRGYEVVFPRYLANRQWTDRVRQVELPLFPGYLFVRCDAQHRLPIVQTPGLLNLVSGRSGPIAVPDFEVENLRRALEVGVPLLPVPYLQAGDQVCIARGPLRGVCGILHEFRSANWVVISVDLLRRSVAVQVNPSCLALQSRCAAG